MLAFAKFLRQMQPNTTTGSRYEGRFCRQGHFRFHKCKEAAPVVRSLEPFAEVPE